MSEYDFGISYIKGKENVVADALSRRPRIFSLIPLRVDLKEKVLEQLLGDGWYIKVTSDIQSGKKCGSKYYGYHIEEYGLLRYQGRMHIPKEGDLREAILREAHRAYYCAHPGVNGKSFPWNSLWNFPSHPQDIMLYS